MEVNLSIENKCEEMKGFCIDCNSHFARLRPLIKSVNVSKKFIKDVKDKEEMNSIIKNILDCSHLEFTELHKFEESIDGNLVFRAKKDEMHIVYCIDKKMRIVFLRALKDFEDYKKFLENRKEISSMIESL